LFSSHVHQGQQTVAHVSLSPTRRNGRSGARRGRTLVSSGRDSISLGFLWFFQACHFSSGSTIVSSDACSEGKSVMSETYLTWIPSSPSRPESYHNKSLRNNSPFKALIYQRTATYFSRYYPISRL
jgi:hypothetical protein